MDHQECEYASNTPIASKAVPLTLYLDVLLLLVPRSITAPSYFRPTTMAAFVPPARLAALTKLRCSVLQTSYNPQSLRTGAKYLKARLRGPSMLSYYPQSFDMAQIIRQNPALELVDEDEEERVNDVLDRKKRGKGAPRKARSKGVFRFRVSVSLFFSFAHALCSRESEVGQEAINITLYRNYTIIHGIRQTTIPARSASISSLACLHSLLRIAVATRRRRAS